MCPHLFCINILNSLTLTHMWTWPPEKLDLRTQNTSMYIIQVFCLFVRLFSAHMLLLLCIILRYFFFQLCMHVTLCHKGISCWLSIVPLHQWSLLWPVQWNEGTEDSHLLVISHVCRATTQWVQHWINCQQCRHNLKSGHQHKVWYFKGALL